MSSVIIKGDTSGQIEIASPAVAGSNTQTLVAATGTLAPLIAATAQTASGSSVDFTNIPSWVKRVTVLVNNLSLTGTANPIIRLGTSGGIESGTVYFSMSGAVTTTNTAAGVNANTGFVIQSTGATNGVSGYFVFANISDNTWILSGTATPNTGSVTFVAGRVALSGTLTQIRLTNNGSDTFDAGTINILYE